jgi:hypothetical protein
VLVADKAINAIGCCGTEQPDCPNLWGVNKNLALIRKSWLIQKKFADLRYERKGFIALLAPAYMCDLPLAGAEHY